MENQMAYYCDCPHCLQYLTFAYKISEILHPPPPRHLPFRAAQHNATTTYKLMPYENN